MLDFDRRELLDLFRILPVMRQGAIALGNAGDRWHNKIPLGLERDPLGGIGLPPQVRPFVHQLKAPDHIVGIGGTLGGWP
jgi:hypothetical protein